MKTNRPGPPCIVLSEIRLCSRAIASILQLPHPAFHRRKTLKRLELKMQLLQARTVMDQRRELRTELAQFFQWIETTPQKNTVKGMYVQGLLDAIDSRGVTRPPRDKIQTFKDYSLREYMELLLDSALTLYPTSTVQVGLRRLGQLAIPTFTTSIVGRVIMGTVGRSWDLALKCVSRGYEVSLKPGKATVAEMTNTRALLQLRDVWNFGDTYQVGVVEGLMDWCGIDGKIVPKVISRSSVDLEIEWQPERVARRFRSQPPRAGATTP
jgi:uncharacterized protein (TIGR02265 family)